MEGSSSTENCLNDSVTKRGAWSPWWIRIPLFVAHLTLLVLALSLTPSGYAFRLGEVAGAVILFSTPLLWLFLWHARERGMFLLFSGLVMAQTGFISFVGFQFRSEDRVLREIEAERAQREIVWRTQMASFRLGRLFEMLNPGNQFHPEELPGLLEQVRLAPITDREQWDQMQGWASDAEKRLAAVNMSSAKEFRRGFESTRARNERIQALNREYCTGMERLITLLLDRRGHYHATKAGLAFDRSQDADAFEQELKSLGVVEGKMHAEMSNSQQ